MKRLRSTSAGRWWLVWVSGGRKWVLGSSKAVNAACLAVFDPSTNSALSRQPESAKKCHMGVYGPPPLNYYRYTRLFKSTSIGIESCTNWFISNFLRNKRLAFLIINLPLEVRYRKFSIRRNKAPHSHSCFESGAQTRIVPRWDSRRPQHDAGVPGMPGDGCGDVQ